MDGPGTAASDVCVREANCRSESARNPYAVPHAVVVILRYADGMNALRGRVRHGHVETETALPEGAEVVVLLPEQGEPFDLDDASNDELVERMKEADRGRIVPAEVVLDRLRAKR